MADLRIERNGPVARVVLDNAARKNRVDAAGMAALADAARGLAAPESDARAVLLTAEGDHFCAGGDLASGVGFGEGLGAGQVGQAILDGPQAAVGAWWALDVPVVAAVRGHAAGFGACLAMTADVVVAAETTVFRFPFTGLGFGPDSGASWLLSRRVGPAKAGAILLLGTAIDAAEALRLGLVHEVVPDAALDDVAASYAARLGEGATVAMRHAKRLVRAGLDTPLDAALAAEAGAFADIVATDDFAEGITAFLERRSPRFEGR